MTQTAQSDLFGPISDLPAPTRAEPPSGPPRLVGPDRHQMRFVPTDLESLLEPEHQARAIWAVVETLDLSSFLKTIASRGDRPGRPAIDPQILVALWLYATSDGVGSARELERLCEAHNAYRWIAGGVHVSHHVLSDFRVDHQDALDQLFTQVLGVLSHKELVDLKRVAQDGLRVRASAGAASFRREQSLTACLDEARAQVEALAQEVHGEPEAAAARRLAARRRAANERQERLNEALKELPKVREAKQTAEEKLEARVSTTDPEARVMKMPDGGFRPAYNVQLSTDTKTRVIVGVGVTTSGNDQGQMRPMFEDIRRRHDRLPEECLVDGGFNKKENIEHAAHEGVTLYAPVQKPKRQDVDPHQPKPDDSPEVAAWRQRMATPEAKQIYKQRAATAETVNADLRCYRGLGPFLVRGSSKVRCVVLWAALTYNILRCIAAGG
jgi:transposase